MSSRARSLFLAPPQPYSHRLHHRVGNTLSLSTLIGNCLLTSVPSWFWSQPPHGKRHILIQEGKVKPAKENLHSVLAQHLVPRNVTSPTISSVSAYWKPTPVAQTLEVLFSLFQAQILEVHAWSRYLSKSPTMQVSSCFLRSNLFFK